MIFRITPHGGSGRNTKGGFPGRISGQKRTHAKRLPQSRDVILSILKILFILSKNCAAPPRQNATNHQDVKPLLFILSEKALF